MALRQVIDQTLALGAPATWVLSNHDVDRIVSRYGRADTAFSLDQRRYFHNFPVEVELGTRRARAAALLTMALSGSVYIYQGEELGLWEVQDIPDEVRQDPIWRRTNGADPGRDGSRVPLPWSGTEPPFGFSPPGATSDPWLTQPKEWRDLTVQAESASADSMLRLYQDALRIRRSAPALGDGPMSWLPAAPSVLAFDRALQRSRRGHPRECDASPTCHPSWYIFRSMPSSCSRAARLSAAIFPGRDHLAQRLVQPTIC